MGGIKTHGSFYGRGVPKNYTGFAQLAAANYPIVQPATQRQYPVGNTAPYGVVPGVGLIGLVTGGSDQYNFNFRFRRLTQ